MPDMPPRCADLPGESALQRDRRCCALPGGKRGSKLAAGADAEFGEDFPQMVGDGGGADEQVRGDLRRDALAAIGIDVSAVRASIEASLGPEALTSASQALHREPSRAKAGPSPRVRRWAGGVFLSHSPGAEQSLHNAHAAAQARHGTQISVVALGQRRDDGHRLIPLGRSGRAAHAHRMMHGCGDRNPSRVKGGKTGDQDQKRERD